MYAALFDVDSREYPLEPTFYFRIRHDILAYVKSECARIIDQDPSMQYRPAVIVLRSKSRIWIETLARTQPQSHTPSQLAVVELSDDGRLTMKIERHRDCLMNPIGLEEIARRYSKG